MSYLIAYFDPSAGSLLLQALVGGFGGIAVVGRYLWMQVRGRHEEQLLFTDSQELSSSAQVEAQ
ncbi:MULTISPECIES: hypothetical protein [unclassified Schlesneria]|uniref:hypothetical protein n=1 Tax=Schlesneria TaxID=656899 RepID=UPI002F11D8D6